ncbi:DUF4978 domain-containing protein [Sphingobacterium bovistauri]|uniref:DUF4978 domain-containing protein n=1 Tax=Sphingobacterium bovistauri TaxID=2781959 RepID=A0ABS7Z7Z5_9SPHI|nr:DUF4978 domain-containing protein [Sphingobacterium bovistauri]MCA5006274.1 DUF4978 domain-containing protein [Sphingobacterium bovistauri]
MMNNVWVLICLLLISCSKKDQNNEEEEPVVQRTPIEVSSMKTTIGGRRYLTVDNKLFLMLGAQLRTDYFIQLDKRKLDQLDDYFALAKSMNITVLQVPIAWRDVEYEKDKYTRDMINHIIGYCEKYDLKLEILWYGSYMCGYSVRGYIPNYVVDDVINYPQLKPSVSFIGWLGKHFYLKPNTPLLVERESKALSYMMDAIYDYNQLNGNKLTVVGIQIQNEADMLATRHNNEHGYTPESIWPDLIDMMATLGRVVKSSAYKCYTRTNLTTTYDDFIERSKQIVLKGGVDFVGLDPYTDQVNVISNMLTDLHAIPNNFAHIGENGGEYPNNDILTLKALIQGAGYSIFEVVTTPHEYLKDWTLRGVYNPDFSKKSHTNRIMDAYKIYKNAWCDFAIAETKNMVGFNIKNNELSSSLMESHSTESVRFNWNTNNSGIGYALENNDYVIVSSTKSDEITMQSLGNKQIDSKAEVGYYDIEGSWIKESEVNIQNNKLSLLATKTYRIKLVL